MTVFYVVFHYYLLLHIDRMCDIFHLLFLFFFLLIILFLSFLDMLSMLVLVSTTSEQDHAHIFQYIYFKSFKIYWLAIMYHFAHTNHRINLNFLFQNLENVNLKYLSCLDNYKNPLSEVMMFHWTCPNHSCIHLGKHLFKKAK